MLFLFFFVSNVLVRKSPLELFRVNCKDTNILVNNLLLKAENSLIRVIRS